jgi:hypothetical protein
MAPLMVKTFRAEGSRRARCGRHCIRVKRWRQVRRFFPSRQTIAFEVASPYTSCLLRVQQQNCLAGRRPNNILLRLCPWEQFIAFLFIRHGNRDQDQLLTTAFMAQKPAKRETLSGHLT